MAIALAAALLSFPLDGLNGLLVDSFFRAHGARPRPLTQSSGIALIALDASVTHGGESDVSMPALIALLERLTPLRPKAIGILADLDVRHYTPEELAQLARSIDPTIPVFVGFLDEAGLSASREASPLGGHVQFAPGLVSRDSFHYGADSVSRRVMLEINRLPTFYSRMATHLRGGRPPKRVYRTGSASHAFIDWTGPAGTYPVYPVWSVGSQVREQADLAGKAVLIGHVRRNRPNQDFVLTPFSRRLGETPQLEAAAQGLATLIDDTGLIRPPWWAVAAVTLLTGLLTVNLVALLSPLRGVGFILGMLALVWTSGWIALGRWGVWLDLAHPMLAGIASYYLVVPFRLGLEYRKRWHFQQRSEMFSELESLKSHFLSLVSHDLKTPIARIQGHAEILLGGRSVLDDKQRQQLDGIVATTEALSEYVQTLLDLTRIESAQVPVQKQSRDINATVEEAIELKRHLAEEKGVRLETRLEPLFNVRYDPRLMRQVLGNLIENAIKYSPENSVVSIASDEIEGRVRVCVTDLGPGIAPEEQTKVFDKFYRGSHTGGNKGTGLGLYLVKYFVQLHKGTVSLESGLGKGSTFSVFLPL